MASLAGRTALVTGGAKRVGREIALALAASGADLLLHYNRSAAEAEETAAECREKGVRADLLRGDFLDSISLERIAAEAAARGAGIFVHNASTFTRLGFFEPVLLHRDMLDRDLRMHLTVPYLLGRLLGEKMVESGWGRIVLVGDWSAAAAVYPNYASYIVSKAAVPALARVLALELGSRCAAVTANAVLPGPVVPPEGHDPEDVAMVKRQTILGDWVGGADVARAVVFLAESAGITGAEIRVDGGRSIKAP